MSGREGTGEFRKRKHDNFPHGHRREEKDSINPPSAMTMSFKAFQVELDTKHDKYERLVKLSRDITIESKRVIFLLHRITSAPNGEEILMESETKLDLVRQKIKQVAQELMGEDMYQFHRAISPEEEWDTSGPRIRCSTSFYLDTEVQHRGPSGGSLTARSQVTGNQAEGLLGSGALPVERPPTRCQREQQLPDF
uniref:Translin associated factor X n=1 Tax=Podarcis muralis TaxID=64176 RepID=A0A670HM25_PODMU